MKISNIFNITNNYKNKTEENKKVNSPKVKLDSVALSEKGKDFQNVLKAMHSNDTTREDRINNIKKQIEEGTYSVSTEKIAEKIISKL